MLQLMYIAVSLLWGTQLFLKTSFFIEVCQPIQCTSKMPLMGVPTGLWQLPFAFRLQENPS